MTATVRLLAPVLALALAGCTSAGAEPDPVAALLGPADLPAGFTQVAPVQGDRAVSSTRPECSGALDAVEIDPPSDPAVREARVYFSDPAGTTVQHVVRAHPPGRAPAEVEATRTVLASCDGFELDYADGTTAAVDIVPQTAPELGVDATMAVLVTVDVGEFTFASHLTLLGTADRTAAVSVAAPDGPDAALVDSLAARAAELLVTG